MSDEDPDSPIGQTVGNYKILRPLSTGGMGTVYYAEHALIGRSAAVKVLHPELSGSKDIVNRFFREAKATTSIKHPGIVEIFDYGYLASGDGYIIMEFLEGVSLARRLKKGGAYGEGEAAMLVRGICSALAAAHQKGIVHRDLKPDNIFLVDDPEAPIGERPKVLDFGIAKLTDVGLAGDGTKTGAVMGTPTYMSPEQCRGTGNVDHRADLYSLGCILYELAAGRPPFKGMGAGELLGAHIHLAPDPPSTYKPGISPEMEQLIMTLLEKEPAKRIQTAPELGHALAKIATRHGYQISMTNVTPQPFRALTPPPTEQPPPPEETAAAGDPTTLTRGAAQSIASHAARTEKRGAMMWIALVIAALAAGSVAFVIVRAPSEIDNAPTPQPARQPPTPAVVAPPAPVALPPAEDVPVVVEPEPKPEEPERVEEPAKGEPEKPVVKTKPKTNPRKPPKKPGKPEPKIELKKPPDPKKPSLIETDI